MNHCEITDWGRRNRDARDSIVRGRQCGEKSERKIANGSAKLGAVEAVPGIDRIERFQFGDPRVFDDAQHIETGVGDRASSVGEADQRQQRARRPHFGKVGLCSFQSGQREDDVADGAGADEEAAGDRRQDGLSYF